jgi:hypothetical protein
MTPGGRISIKLSSVKFKNIVEDIMSTGLFDSINEAVACCVWWCHHACIRDIWGCNEILREKMGTKTKEESMLKITKMFRAFYNK